MRQRNIKAASEKHQECLRTRQRNIIEMSRVPYRSRPFRIASECFRTASERFLIASERFRIVPEPTFGVRMVKESSHSETIKHSEV